MYLEPGKKKKARGRKRGINDSVTRGAWERKLARAQVEVKRTGLWGKKQKKKKKIPKKKVGKKVLN